jgi:gamma-glutamylcyclotransferase (GGCT)/AIG2-like uncharacterized protein YtfP
VNTIFVYGLLKPGHRLHHVAEPFVERASRARARGRLYDAGVPAARFDEDGDIEGYVFWLEPADLDEALRVLDELEDEGVEYRRITIDVSTGEGTLAAHAYEYLLPLDGRPDVGPVWPEVE